MRIPIRTLLVVALAATACAGPASDEATDDVVVDTVAVDDAAAPPDAATIPARFRGEWNADRSACGTGASESRLRVGADEIRFYESVGAVRSVTVVSDRVVVVNAEYQGEGDTWQDERRLTLAPGGESLTVSGGTNLVRYRCP